MFVTFRKSPRLVGDVAVRRIGHPALHRRRRDVDVLGFLDDVAAPAPSPPSLEIGPAIRGARRRERGQLRLALEPGPGARALGYVPSEHTLPGHCDGEQHDCDYRCRGQP